MVLGLYTMCVLVGGGGGPDINLPHKVVNSDICQESQYLD